MARVTWDVQLFLDRGVNVPDFVEKALIDAVNYYFDTLDCLMKQEIESLLGLKLHL